MEADERRRRLNLLLRERHGNDRRDRLRTLLMDGTGPDSQTAWSLVPPREADATRVRMLNAYRAVKTQGEVQTFVVDDPESLVTTLGTAHGAPSGDQWWVNLHDSQYVGLVTCDRGFMLQTLGRLMEFDGEELLCAAEDLTHGGFVDIEKVEEGIRLTLQTWDTRIPRAV